MWLPALPASTYESPFGSPGALPELLLAANQRYLQVPSAIDDPNNGIDKLNKITRSVHDEPRSISR